MTAKEKNKLRKRTSSIVFSSSEVCPNIVKYNSTFANTDILMTEYTLLTILKRIWREIKFPNYLSQHYDTLIADMHLCVTEET